MDCFKLSFYVTEDICTECGIKSMVVWHSFPASVFLKQIPQNWCFMWCR